jgi:hypothetical protein
MFPTSQVAGTLEWSSSWDPERGPVFATGEVAIPDDEEIAFSGGIIESVGGHADGLWSWSSGLRPLDLAFLRELPSDAFVAVTLSRPLVESSVEFLPHLASGLRRLTLATAWLHDESLAHVAQLKGITSLQTFGNDFTDAGVQYLAALTNLEWLWLEEETLSGQAIDFAVRLTRLQRLGLKDVPITEEDLRRLRALLPDVDVG